MSNWFLSSAVEDAAYQESLTSGELAIPTEGLPDLTRAQGADQIAGWLHKIHPETPPEQIGSLSQYYWRLGHELMLEDMLVIRFGNVRCNVAEITGTPHHRETAAGSVHVVPVRWRHKDIPLPVSLAAYPNEGLFEITDEVALAKLGPYFGKSKINAAFFRWLGITILIFELIYFWPKSH